MASKKQWLEQITVEALAAAINNPSESPEKKIASVRAILTVSDGMLKNKSVLRKIRMKD